MAFAAIVYGGFALAQNVGFIDLNRAINLLQVDSSIVPKTSIPFWLGFAPLATALALLLPFQGLILFRTVRHLLAIAASSKRGELSHISAAQRAVLKRRHKRQ